MDARRQTAVMTWALAALLMMPAGVGAQQQGARPPGTHQDNTEGKEWIRRLERPERIPGPEDSRGDRQPRAPARRRDCRHRRRHGHVHHPVCEGRGAVGHGAYAVDIWPELLDYMKRRPRRSRCRRSRPSWRRATIPMLPKGQVDVVFFHDVFHNTNDRAGYLKRARGRAQAGRPHRDRRAGVRRSHREEVGPAGGSHHAGAGQGVDGRGGLRARCRVRHLQGAKNPPGTGMPERWFVVYRARTTR